VEKMQILKDIVWLFPHERVDILEIYKGKKMVFYNYSYRIENASGEWVSRVIWHNFDQLPHFDIYDQNEKLILTREQEAKSITEIVKLVKVFRKNLMNMDLSKV
jgi:hypothetical protein